MYSMSTGIGEPSSSCGLGIGSAAGFVMASIVACLTFFCVDRTHRRMRRSTLSSALVSALVCAASCGDDTLPTTFATYCIEVDEEVWDDSWAAFEDEVLRLV